jgi:thioredoxin reductase
MHDAIIVGGGPAGLSAALLLGRARRRVLLVDAGEGRNARAHAIHGFLTRDGTPPAEFRRMAQEELRRYPSVELRQGEVEAARRNGDGFAVTLAGQATESRSLLLATGLADDLPNWPGLDEAYGTDVWRCPYCDGFERQNEPLAVHGAGHDAVRLAVEVRNWTGDLVACTEGPVSRADRQRLAALNIGLREGHVTALRVEEGRLRALRFADGSELERAGVFLAVAQRPRSALAESLGCKLTAAGQVRADRHGGTDIPGLFIAGDASPGLQLAVVAAAQGSIAAFHLNAGLLKQESHPQ